MLRGRDIKKYQINFSDKWIINTHNGTKINNISPIKVQEDYPIIYNHLMKYKDELQKRQDRGDHWTNLRNCAYLDDFDKEKLVWIELTDKPNFALDTNGFYLNNTIFFMTGKHLKYLMGYLNSKICEWHFDKIAATSGVGTRRWIKVYIDQICIPMFKSDVENDLYKLIDNINNETKNDILKKINTFFYKKFDLTEEEIEEIENSNL
ncbi:TaqI-like C-terminal specificity domain-containing protein [Flavobacterium collinsii]|uniref:TaqI-like C-terminal specificity domain-containing protein n=1 Tax=Flavobacterium collinsii TaxID=1114861 RepID=UPI00375810EB